MGLDSGYNLLHLAADAHLGAQKLLGLLYRLAGNDLSYLELKLLEVFKSNLCFRFNINNSLSVVCSIASGSGSAFCISRSPRCTSCCLGRFFLLYLCQNLIHIQTGKQDLRLICYLCAGLIQPKHIHDFQRTLLCAQLSQNFLSSLRHERLQQAGSDADALYQVIKHGCQPVFLALILCQSPGHGLIDIFIAPFEQCENLCNRVCHAQLVHLLRSLLSSCHGSLPQLSVHRFNDARIVHHASKILV